MPISEVPESTCDVARRYCWADVGLRSHDSTDLPTEIRHVSGDFATGGEVATRVRAPGPNDVLTDIDVDLGRSATSRADCLRPSPAFPDQYVA